MKTILTTLVLFAGQSNALGYGNNEPPSYRPTPRVQIWADLNRNGVLDARDGFQTMAPGRNTGTPANPRAWGPEVAFAQAWLATNPRGTLYIGKVAKGSTALARNPQEDWSPQSRGEWFDAAATVSAGMRAKLDAPRLDAVFWMQGEEDATRADWSRAYAANLKGFLVAARSRWMNDPQGFVALGRIGSSPAMRFHREVQSAQAAVDAADPRTESFPTAPFPRQPDRLHLDARGHVALGRAFHDAWAR